MITSTMRTAAGQAGYNLLDAGGQPVLIGAATPNFVGASQPNVAAAGTVGYQAFGRLTRRGSGSVLVKATISVNATSSTGTTITVTLTRDGVPLPGSLVHTLAAAATAGLSIVQLDALPDDLPHTYGVQATVSTGTATLTAGQGTLIAIEL